jgi:exosortase A-associated hydrolase 2
LTPQGSRIEAFFLPAAPGSRFALFTRPRGALIRGAFLYLHPFAEEMNKSRRMAAVQTRAFADAGFAVLQIDLHGCGDSSGDFVEARWDTWRRDVAVAADWLAANASGPLHIWGLRLGATLALECWRDAPERFASAIIWQPVLQGESFMTQFLRLAVAGDVVRPSEQTLSTEDLRGRLREGEVVEVAGYELAPDLVHAIDARRLDGWALPGAEVNWLDVRRTTGATPAGVQRVLDRWQANDVRPNYGCVGGDAFWSSFDIIEVPELVTTTTALYTREIK